MDGWMHACMPLFCILYIIARKTDDADDNGRFLFQPCI